jgi:hypothetical protein
MSGKLVVVTAVLIAAGAAGWFVYAHRRDLAAAARAAPPPCATFAACIREADAGAAAKAPERPAAAAILALYERAVTFASTADEIRSARGGAIVLSLEISDCGRARRHIDAVREARPASRWLQVQYAQWRKACRAHDDVHPLVVHERAEPVAAGVLDDRTVAVINDGQLQIWSVPEQRIVARQPRAEGCLAVSPDGRWVATGCGSRTISVFAWSGDALSLASTSQPFPISEALRDANYSGVHRFDDEWGRHGVIERLQFQADGALLALSDGWLAVSGAALFNESDQFRFQVTLAPLSWHASPVRQVPFGGPLEPQGPLTAQRGRLTATLEAAALVVSDQATGAHVTLAPARMALDTIAGTVAGGALTFERRSVRRFDLLQGTLVWSYEQDADISAVVPLDVEGHRALVYGPTEATILDLADGSYTCDWKTARPHPGQAQLMDVTAKYVLESVGGKVYATAVEDCTATQLPDGRASSLVVRRTGRTYAASGDCEPGYENKKCELHFEALDGGDPLPPMALTGSDDMDDFRAVIFADDDALLVEHQSSCSGSSCVYVNVEYTLHQLTANGWSPGRRVDAATSLCGRAVWLGESPGRYTRLLEGGDRGGPIAADGAPFSLDANGVVRFTTSADDGNQHAYDFFTGGAVTVEPGNVEEGLFARFDHSIGFQSPFTLRTRGVTAELFARRDDEYAILSSGGEYLATPGFRDLIRFTDGIRNYPAEDHDLRFNRPDLVLAALGASTDLVDAYEARVTARREVLGDRARAADASAFVELTKPLPAIVSQRTLPLAYRAVALEGAIIRSLVYVNGHLARTVENPHKKRSAAWESWIMDEDTTVSLSAGLNKIQVYALDSVERRSTSVSAYVLNAKPLAKPTLHVVAVGISAYPADAWQLQYGRSDAERVAAALTQVVGTSTAVRLGAVRVLVDEQATKRGIIAEFERLKKSADLDDVLIVYLAGHGFARGASGYTFATHDFDFDKHTGGAQHRGARRGAALDRRAASPGVHRRL